MTDIDLTAAVTIPTGVLFLTTDPYDLHTDTRAQRAQSWRKTTVENDHVEGSYTIRAVRENVPETISVWVSGLATRRAHADAVEALEAAFSQLHYQIVFGVGLGTGADIEVWDCEVADYTIDTQQAYLMSQKTLFKATVPRLPAVRRA